MTWRPCSPSAPALAPSWESSAWSKVPSDRTVTVVWEIGPPELQHGSLGDPAGDPAGAHPHRRHGRQRSLNPMEVGGNHPLDRRRGSRDHRGKDDGADKEERVFHGNPIVRAAGD